jgi:phosphonate transport system substrate-binding protein
LRDFVIRLMACLLVLFAGSAAIPARAAGDPHVLVLGCVSDDPKTDYELLKPLLDYVVPRMAGVGIHAGRILMARDVQQMGSYLRRGRVDWVTGSAATGVLLQARAGASPLLLTERNGVTRDHAVFFVRRDSGIVSLQDLRGRSVAFQDDWSTGAWFVPATQLLQQGLSLQAMPMQVMSQKSMSQKDMSLKSMAPPADRPDDTSVGYVFARSELNIATWVHKRLVDAGTISSLDWHNPQRMPPTWRSEFKIIDESPEYPLALEMVRGDLDASVRARLHDVLIEAAGDPDAGEALLQFSSTTRFLPIDAATQEALRHVRDGIARVHAEVE